MIDSSNFSNITSAAGKLHARRLTAKMRRDAYENGWPTNLSRQLKVKYDGGRLHVDFPTDIIEDILDLEYGTQNTAPNPVIHRTLNRNNDHTAELDKALGKFLDGFIR